MNKVGVQIIFGRNSEPFLEAALRSVEWADYFCAVNTSPDDGPAAQNEATFRRVVPRDKQRLTRLRMGKFDFARARNEALALADLNDYVLLVDSDDVHWPDFELSVRNAISVENDVSSAHFWHHCVYKDLWHSIPHREILFKNIESAHFVNTMGNVHEELVHPRNNEWLIPDYKYHHYGYIKPAREVARRWEFYRSLGATIHDYDTTQPEHALDAWIEICHPFTGEHPPAVREVLERLPAVPLNWLPTQSGPSRTGLVLLTWNDAELLKRMLRTLSFTTRLFTLVVVDNGSTDETIELIEEWRDQYGLNTGPSVHLLKKEEGGLSLSTALNWGFQFLLDADPDLEFLGWIHPDHTFEWPDWLARLEGEMDEHPEFVKLGASEAGNQTNEFRTGNTQCYIIRRSALEKVGLFNEGFKACGGYEDWEHNYRLLNVGKVMISPNACVRHEGMQTRKRHDNVEAGRENADFYHELVGHWDPVV